MLEAGRLISKEAPGSRSKPHQIVARGIIHMPQGDLMFPGMSVYENLMMGAYLPEADSRASHRLARAFALFPRLTTEEQVASTLSGGERRMFAIGRGLMGGGRLLMIDEPSLGLAPLVIDQIYEVIARLQRRDTPFSSSRRMRAESSVLPKASTCSMTASWSGRARLPNWRQVKAS